MNWQTQRDENLAKRETAMAAARAAAIAPAASVAALPDDESRYTALQLELFAANPADFEFVEALLTKLPRKRQREHFRKVYLNAYRSVPDDGSIGYRLGNKQRRAANDFLREVLDVRLKKVFAQYRINVSFLFAFANKPNWQIEFELKQDIERKTVTVSTAAEQAAQAAEWERYARAFTPYVKRQRQAAELPFYLITENKLREIALQLASAFEFEQAAFIDHIAPQLPHFSPEEKNGVVLKLYHRCATACDAIGFPMPHAEKIADDKPVKGEHIDAALAKITCPKYWFKRMRTTQRRIVEHIAIACGEVRKQAGSYVSHHTLNQWAAQRKKNHDYLKAMILENIDNPDEQAELFDMYLRSTANPALRRHEMMTRLRGLEEWAEENGNEALFLTLTAPSSFHAVHSSGDINRKWSGCSPRVTQRYLNKVWKQYRALLAKRGIKFYGMRVAEPHHDGTPHWHLLVYMKSEHKAEVIRLFRQKALELDGDEKGAKAHRCSVDEIDREIGSATAYIAKYIVKNIDGFAADGEMSDENPALNLKDNARRVRAWASTWGIRQFQFYGGTSITVWRELRRLVKGQCDDEILENARLAADVSCFASLVQIQGGALAKRCDQPIKPQYEIKPANLYGEQRKAVIGLENRFSLKSVISRLKKWAIKRKPKGATPHAEQGSAQTSGQCPPWTCVSNCNHAEIEQRLKNVLLPVGGMLKPPQIDYLLTHGRLRLNHFRWICHENGQFFIEEAHKPLQPLPAFGQSAVGLGDEFH